MNISGKLKHVTPLEILVNAIRQCYESFDNSDSKYEWKDNDEAPSTYEFVIGPKDKALIERIIASGHHSTLEHITFNFQIKGISRLNLQELARHRMASLSVKSTRYTLKELKDEPPFYNNDNVVTGVFDNGRISKYINLTGISEIDAASIYTLENLRKLVASGKYINDEIKYTLPECYRLDLYWSINARSLRNFLQLRDSDKAHFEIRELAQKLRQAVPEDYQFILG